MGAPLQAVEAVELGVHGKAAEADRVLFLDLRNLERRALPFLLEPGAAELHEALLFQLGETATERFGPRPLQPADRRVGGLGEQRVEIRIGNRVEVRLGSQLGPDLREHRVHQGPPVARVGPRRRNLQAFAVQAMKSESAERTRRLVAEYRGASGARRVFSDCGSARVGRAFFAPRAADGLAKGLVG